MRATGEQIARQIRTLTDEEQEQRFAKHLLALGMLDHIPPGYPKGYIEPPAIIIDGEPLSETVIRERR